MAKVEQLGLRNDWGQPISKGCLEKFLSNPFYTGVIKIRRTGAVYQGAHEPLISAQLFKTVQDIKDGKSGKKTTRHNHTYRGLFQCSNCSKAMIPERQKGHVYYRCHTQDCPSNCIREERLEHAVHSALKRVRISDEQITWLSDEIEKWLQQRDPEKDAKSVALQLSQLEAKLERLTDALIDRLIEQEVFNTRKQTVLLEKAHLKDLQHKLAKMRSRPGNIRKFLELIKNLAEHYISAGPARKREIVDIATSNRRVVNKNVYLEPANWLIATEQLLVGFSCAQSRPTSRRRSELRNQQLAALADLAQSDTVHKIEAVFAQTDKPPKMEPWNKTNIK